ncbi:MAG: LacI family DNA-binding transcriptional regulator [Oscillospiraceae bacterium]|nr:LacI family DNA-binding transcriptional regulator [Oscillospiraceae bacterium]
MNVTIKDVAKAAGVSVATVSRVLNNSAAVSASAAENVNNAIRELGYSPNFLGRNLRKCETNVILAIIPSTEQTFYSDIIRGMQNAASESGYDILLSTSNSSHNVEMRLLNMLFNRTVDAAILLGTQLDVKTLTDLNKQHYIALCCERVDGADVLTVTVDDKGGAFAAVDKLIKMGHRKIGMVSTSVNSLSSYDREQGYKKALEENGINTLEEYIYRGTYDFKHGVKAFEHFMGLPEPPSAIFCISDILAASVVKKAISEGYSVGKDISVCGFDNILLSWMYTPGITTVEQPCYDIGRTVVEELISNINNSTKSNKKIMLPYKIIERESVGQYDAQ